MTGFKICGIRSAEHALVAAEAGASFMGFVFVEGVRRQLAVDDAQAIIGEYRATRDDSEGPGLAGLFADQPSDFVAEVAERCGLDYVQLCGSEGPDYWDRMPVPVLRAVRIRDDGERDDVVRDTMEIVRDIAHHGQTPHLDTYRPEQPGGTGHTFDWAIAAAIAEKFRVILAGGLTPGNVGAAIAAATPWCVDVSTGVETEGVKDPAKIRAFAEAVRAADAALPSL